MSWLVALDGPDGLTWCSSCYSPEERAPVPAGYDDREFELSPFAFWANRCLYPF
jgi:hypothetical protein